MKYFFLLLLPFFYLTSSPKESGNLLHVEINLEKGSKLILNDDSIWEIDPEDRKISSLWLSPSPIQISTSDSKDYPYLLTDISSQEKIKARPSSTAVDHPD